MGDEQMSKFTDCQWIAVGGMVEVEDDRIADICSCYPYDMGQDHLKRSEEEIMANARLIAAAPALLDALLHMMDCFTDDHRWDGVPVADKARAAVFLALGEEYEQRH